MSAQASNAKTTAKILHMISSETTKRISSCLVACNIYISAGRSPQTAPILLNLLQNAQEMCQSLRQQSSLPIAVVHAFADRTYDRSSFHLAGSSTLVACLASHFTRNAIDVLSNHLKETKGSGADTSTPHPSVGLVDHVAILPLCGANNEATSTIQKAEWNEALSEHCLDLPKSLVWEDYVHIEPTLPTGWVARSIGNVLHCSGVQVFYYGHADPENIPLATVRKQKTQFFKPSPTVALHASKDFLGQATVGAPPHFVENYNIQVATRDKRNAQALTRSVRSRDDGLDFCEALTLSYRVPKGEETPIYEVACNLLNPDITSSKDIDGRVEEWQTKQKTEDVNILKSYRVGTTERSCLDALAAMETKFQEDHHDAKVANSFESDLR